MLLEKKSMFGLQDMSSNSKLKVLLKLEIEYFYYQLPIHSRVIITAVFYGMFCGYRCDAIDEPQMKYPLKLVPLRKLSF